VAKISHMLSLPISVVSRSIKLERDSSPVICKSPAWFLKIAKHKRCLSPDHLSVLSLA
jgi:hypothetical protein